MKPYARSERVREHIQRTLSELLQRRIKDPRLEGATVTGVRLSSDLKRARIYFAAFGGEKSRRQAREGFDSAEGFLKRTLAARLGLRYMPAISFHYDESFDYGSRIEQVIETVKQEDGADHQPTD